MTSGNRNRVMVALDFQNLGVTANNVPALDAHIVREVERIIPTWDDGLFKAFCRPNQRAAINALAGLQWRNQSSPTDLDEAIVQQCMSYCGQDRGRTILFLCTKDGDFVNLVRHLRGRGVLVYVMGPHNTNRHLIQEAGNGWIQLPNF